MTPIDFDPDTTPNHLDAINRRIGDGKLLAFESRHRRKDGSVFPVEIRGQAFFEGGRRFVIALSRDISERKWDEVLLEGQKRILERIVQGAAPQVLTFLCGTIEGIARGEMLASVLLLDADGVHLKHGAVRACRRLITKQLMAWRSAPTKARVDRLPIGVSPSLSQTSPPMLSGAPMPILPYHTVCAHAGRRRYSPARVMCSARSPCTTATRAHSRDVRVVDIVTRTVAIAIERSSVEEGCGERASLAEPDRGIAAVGMDRRARTALATISARSGRNTPVSRSASCSAGGGFKHCTRTTGRAARGWRGQRPSRGRGRTMWNTGFAARTGSTAG